MVEGEVVFLPVGEEMLWTLLDYQGPAWSLLAPWCSHALPASETRWAQSIKSPGLLSLLELEHSGNLPQGFRLIL